MKNRNKLYTLLLLFEILVFVLSAFLLLYVNPSEVGRMRGIYIIMQVFLCAVCVFAFRALFGVFKKVKERENPRFTTVNLKILAADLLAFIIIYLIQKLLPNFTPPVRINFVQEACIIGFNLIVAVCVRMVYQAIYDWCEPYDRQWDDSY